MEKIKIVLSLVILTIVVSAASQEAPKTTYSGTVPTTEGTTLSWGDFAPKLLAMGVIDSNKFETVMGGLTPKEKSIFAGTYQGQIEINKDESRFLLNVFWALGLANKSSVLDKGPMGDYKNRAYLASTGGWTVGRERNGDSYFSRYKIITLTPAKEALVYEVASNTYRPCCDNPTLFPDCNHGAALLGVLELAASQGLDKQNLYDLALEFNSLWFPDHYKMMTEKFPNSDAKTKLYADFSSASGWRKNVAAQVKNGSSCGL